MGEYVAAFLLKTLHLTMRGFLLCVIFRKNELKLSNREVNPEVSGRLRRWYCPPRRDGRVCRRLSFEKPLTMRGFLLPIYRPDGTENNES